MSLKKATVGIIGGKFGLYGYLPAILELYSSVTILSRFKEFLNSRDDLSLYVDRINWSVDELEIINECDVIIFAVPPKAQMEIVTKNIESLRGKNVFLEKPIADSPENAQILRANLKKYSINHFVNYTFIELDWFGAIKTRLLENTELLLHIEWKFTAHHFSEGKDSWKMYHSEGGGCLRFYSIHLIASMVALGFKTVKSSALFYCSENIPYKWLAVFENKDNGQAAHISVDCRSSHRNFFVGLSNNGSILFEEVLSEPFELKNKIQFHDNRSFFIKKTLGKPIYTSSQLSSFYDDTDSLWLEVESKTAKVLKYES